MYALKTWYILSCNGICCMDVVYAFGCARRIKQVVELAMIPWLHAKDSRFMDSRFAPGLLGAFWGILCFLLAISNLYKSIWSIIYVIIHAQSIFLQRNINLKKYLENIWDPLKKYQWWCQSISQMSSFNSGSITNMQKAYSISITHIPYLYSRFEIQKAYFMSRSRKHMPWPESRFHDQKAFILF